MALLRAARCFDQTRGFAFSTYAVCLIRRDLHDAMQLPVGFFRARTISARDRRDAGPDFHDKRAVDPLDELIRREEAEAVRAALRRLPARNADAVRLRFFDGASLREIAGEKILIGKTTGCHDTRRRLFLA
jgi:RNA polymerase sigma factor (sigma-70 family)